jgi:hypothetical protein
MEYKLPMIKDEPIKKHELIWSEKEEKEISERICNLKNDQLGALLNILLGFNEKDIPEIVVEIKEQKMNSGHLSILLEEADSKEKIEWWISYFEKANKTA